MRPSIAASQQPAFRGWSPMALGSDLYELFDVNTVSSLSISSGLVNSIQGLKGGRVLTQGVSGYKPVLEVNGLRGKHNLLVFDGMDDYLDLTGVGNLPIGADGVMIWAIVDQRAPESDSTIRTVFSYGGAGNSDRRLRRAHSGGNGGTQSFVASDGTSFQSQNTAYNAADVFLGPFGFRGAVLLNPARLDVRSIKGTASQSERTAPATADGTVTLGKIAAGSSQFWMGGVNAIAVTKVLTGSNEQRMWDWIGSRLA